MDKIGTKKIKIDDAFILIKSIMKEEKDKYTNKIISMNKKLNEQKLEIERLKNENIKYKNKFLQLQSQFNFISRIVGQIGNFQGNKIRKGELDNSIDILNKVKNDILQTLNNEDDIFLDNTFENNTMNMNNIEDINLNQNKKINEQFYNKSILRKINSFNKKSERINLNKSFNDTKFPIRILGRKNDSRNYYFFTGKPNNKFSNIIYDNYRIQKYSSKQSNSHRGKYNNIQNKIQKLRRSLSINNLEEEKDTNDICKDFSKTKYHTYFIDKYALNAYSDNINNF